MVKKVRNLTQSATSVVYCICKQPENGRMIYCDTCTNWFHFPCVGVTKRKADILDQWFFMMCTVRKLEVINRVQQKNLDNALAEKCALLKEIVDLQEEKLERIQNETKHIFLKIDLLKKPELERRPTLSVSEQDSSLIGSISPKKSQPTKQQKKLQNEKFETKEVGRIADQETCMLLNYPGCGSVFGDPQPSAQENHVKGHTDGHLCSSINTESMPSISETNDPNLNARVLRRCP